MWQMYVWEEKFEKMVHRVEQLLSSMYLLYVILYIGLWVSYIWELKSRIFGHTISKGDNFHELGKYDVETVETMLGQLYLRIIKILDLYK